MVLELRQGAEETNKNKNASVRWQLQQGIPLYQICGVEDNQKMMKSTEDDEKAMILIYGHSTKTFRNNFRLTKRPFSRIHSSPSTYTEV